MRILAIDPGFTTGVCQVDVSSKQTDLRVELVGEIPWDSRFEMVKALVNGTYLSPSEVPQPPEAVVVESFRLRQARAFQQTGSDFPSVQVIGIIQTFMWQRGTLDTFHFQEPSVMARIQILDEHREYLVGSEHAKDAYKHARYYHLTRVYQA